MRFESVLNDVSQAQRAYIEAVTKTCTNPMQHVHEHAREWPASMLEVIRHSFVALNVGSNCNEALVVFARLVAAHLAHLRTADHHQHQPAGETVDDALLLAHVYRLVATEYQMILFMARLSPEERLVIQGSHPEPAVVQ